MIFYRSLPIMSLLLHQTLSNLINIYPNTVHAGNSVAQFVSGSAGFDGPKVTPNNGTSYDWWYFDAVSAENNCSIVIVFYIATNTGFPFVLSGSALSIDFFATFENGTTVVFPINSQPSGEAIIVTNGNGSTGYWNSTGAQWVGTASMSSYVITINSPTLGIKGSLTLNSVSPAHYPCGPIASGANLEVSPNIGWANAVPDANALADFTINGTPIQFTGPGYHDKNWGVQPFGANVDSWYWGHGRLGPYSLVWFDIVGADGNEYVSSYAALDGTIIASSCSGIKVRPTGQNSQYPPAVSTGNPEGFHIDLDLPSGQVLEVNVTTSLVVVDVGLYARYTGELSGGVQGSTVYTGVALYEEFKLTG